MRATCMASRSALPAGVGTSFQPTLKRKLGGTCRLTASYSLASCNTCELEADCSVAPPAQERAGDPLGQAIGPARRRRGELASNPLGQPPSLAHRRRGELAAHPGEGARWHRGELLPRLPHRPLQLLDLRRDRPEGQMAPQHLLINLRLAERRQVDLSHQIEIAVVAGIELLEA